MRKITKLLLCMVLVIAVACSAMTVFAQEQTTNVAENVQTGQQYADLDKALLDAAQDGQTVKLLQNANANVLTVYENVTLDLNGWELSASYASVYGHVVDNSEANSGVLNVGTRMLIQANNKQLPVKTDKGYQFVEIVGFNTAWMNDTTFVFQPLFEASAHEMLKNGVADTDVSIQVEVTWRPSEGSEHLDSRIFKYGDNFVTQFVNSYNPATGKYGKMFTLTLVNPQNYVDLSCNTKVVAKAGVAFSPVKVSNAAKIGETEYATVQDALDAAQDGQTVTLLENVKATKYLDVYSAGETGRSVTLDLNGKTISWGADYKYQWYPLVFVGVNQTLTIENGSIVADQHVAVGAYGHVNLISVDVSVLTASEGEQAVCIWDWSEEDKYYPDYQHNVTGSGSITGGSITGGLLIEGTTQLSADAGFDKLYINTETGYGKAVLPEGYGLVAENDYFVNLHAHIEEAVAGKAATCTETGLTEGKKCTVCGTTTVEQEKIDALGHKEETVAGKAATCTETGLTDGKKCTVCGVTTVAQTEISATGEHSYEDGACTVCGAADPDAEEEAVVTTLATFELGADGAAEHKENTTAATKYSEEVNGYTLNITGGNKMYPESYDAKGNSCIKLGTSSVVGGFTFTVPDKVTEVVIYVAKYKANTTKVEINGEAHTLTKNSNDGEYDEIAIDTTTTKTITVTTVSGGVRAMVNTIVFKGIINCKHENTVEVEAKDPTCTEDGNLAGVKCADCGTVLAGCDVIPATGHVNTTTATKDATCTEDGYTQVICSCGHVEETSIPALGHIIKDGECERCHETFGANDPKLLATFTLGADGSASHYDGSSKTTYSETVGGYTLSITSGTQFYTGARDAKGNSCLKLGSSKNTGSFKITVPENVTEVTIYIAKYKTNTSKVTINGTTYTLTKNSNNGEYDKIVIDTTATKTITVTTVSGAVRAMVNTIEFVGIED